MRRTHFTCTVDGCQKPHLSKGHCNAHYIRFKKTGSVDAAIPVSKSRYGNRNSNWNGGVMHDGHGRTLLYRPEHPDANAAGYVYQYRLVMEQTLGRRLLKSEIVHHDNENPSSDDPGNLEVMDQPAHARLHSAKTDPQTVLALRSLVQEMSVREAAQRLGVPLRRARAIAYNETWRTL